MNRVIKTNHLNRKQARALDKLIADCNGHDGTHYSFPEDADKIYLMYAGKELVAAAALFLMGDEKEGRAIYELAAFTSPKHRRKRYFESLVAALRRKISGQYIRYAIYGNPSAYAVLSHRGAVHDHDELVMELMLAGDDTEISSIGTIKQEKTLENIHIDFETGHASSSFAECWFKLNADGSEAYIFGVLTFANHLRQGHAYKLLSFLYIKLKERFVKRISLQVSSENIPALKLYEKLGMSVVERLELYYELF